jgi:hypothetical protein
VYRVTLTQIIGTSDFKNQATYLLCLPIAFSFASIPLCAETLSGKLEAGARGISQKSPHTAGLQQEYQMLLDGSVDPFSGTQFDQESFLLGNAIQVTAGTEEDSWQSMNSSVAQYATLDYPNGDSNLRVQYSEGIDSPDNTELYRHHSAISQIEPDRFRSLAIRLEQNLGSVFRASIAGFFLGSADHNSTEGPIQDVASYSAFERSSSYGTEAELEANWGGGFRSQLSYAYVASDEMPSRSPAPSAPRHFGRLNFFLPVVHEILFAGLELQTSSSRVMMAGSDAKEYAVMNTILFAHSLTKGLDVTAILYNMFDSRSGYVGSGTHWQDLIYQDSRTFKLKLTYRF